MTIYYLDGADLKMMLRGAVDLLGQSKEEVNSLNVFPVPDGDTGANMHQTLLAALNEASKVDSTRIDVVAEAIARGGLVGARGNSGVILSQILHGFSFSLRGKEKATAPDIAEALGNGAKMAYQAVITPVEGTILTVVRKSADGAATQRSRNLLRMMVAALKNAFTALQQTTDLLPALKQAGVVDAGGKGFVIILEGFMYALKSASPIAKNPLEKPLKARKDDPFKDSPAFHNNVGVINYAYCTELMVKGTNLPLEDIKNELAPFGDSMMVVGGGNLARVHIHSNNPGMVLERCLRYGTLHDININNMLDQNMTVNIKQTGADKPFAIVAVGAGEGITKIMKNLGADAVVAGGQTLNPSTGEILKIINDSPAQEIIILPNNKNIILAAGQAGRMSSKNVTVIPSKSIPQGIGALITLNPGDDFITATVKMKESLSSVRTGEITRAVRDTIYNGMIIKEGELIGLSDGELKHTGTNIATVFEALLEEMIDGDGRLITLYCGESTGINEAEKLVEMTGGKFGNQEFEIQTGGQPVYDLIISVE